MRNIEYFDEPMIRQTIECLKPNRELFEVRIIQKGNNRKKTISGYFRDAETLINALDTIDPRGSNFYLTINKVNEACYDREQHDCFRVTDVSTHDYEIDEYQWLFIDLDPERISEVSSTDEELEEAVKLADKVYTYMKESGFKEPVRALSGNGAHLLYRVQLSNTDENKALMLKCLNALALIFNNSKVKIDEVNHNQSRVCKLYGTLAQKGSNTDRRKHRFSRITSAPEKIEVNSRELLESLAAELPEVPKTEKRKTVQTDFNLEDWMYDHGLEPIGKGSGIDCDIYPLAECPFDHSHKNGDSKIFHYSNGAIAFKCHHNSCRGYKWQDVREKLEPGAYDDKDEETNRRIEEGWKQHKAIMQYVTVTKTADVEEVKKNLPVLNLINSFDLQSKEFGERYYAVDDLIPEGETIIAAPPKTGKSWLMLDMCIRIAKGEPFLGFNTKQSDTLYLALEDGDSFEQERLNIVMNGEAAPKNFHFVFQDVMPMNEGFLIQIDEVLKKFPNIKVIVIDTLQFIKYRQGKSESAYECDYRTGRDLKKYAEEHHLAIVVVTHTTKSIHIEDDMANVSGTNGVTGAADSIVVLSKESRTDTDAKMFIVGRKVRQSMHTIRFDDQCCRWNYVGIATPVNKDKREQEEKEKLYYNSNIRVAVIEIASKISEAWKGRAGDLVETAAKYKVGIRESNKEIGGFLSQMQGMFLDIDGIEIEKIRNGNASTIYKIYPFVNDESDDDNPFG